jgi:hypothetical protein
LQKISSQKSFLSMRKWKWPQKGLKSLSLSSPLVHLIVITPNDIPRLGDILIPIDPLPLGSSIKLFKPECSGD